MEVIIIKVTAGFCSVSILLRNYSSPFSAHTSHTSCIKFIFKLSDLFYFLLVVIK